MRIILHGERRLMDVGVDALEDVLAAARGSNSIARPWTRGWRGTATLAQDELVVEASKRTSAGRRRVRVVAGPEAIVNDVGAGGVSADDRLAMLVGLVDGVEPTSADDDDDERARPGRLMAAFGIDPPHPDWTRAVARPGSPHRPPVVDVRTAHDDVLRLSPFPEPGEEALSEEATRILVDDALHVDVFETGKDIFVRIGTPPRFDVSPGTSQDVMRVLSNNQSAPRT